MTLFVKAGCQGQYNPEGDSQEGCTNEEISLLYAKIEVMFDRLSLALGSIQVLDNSNVVAVEYLGPGVPFAMSTTAEDVLASPVDHPPDHPPEGTPYVDKLANGDNNDASGVTTALLIATSGSIIAMALLTAGLRRGREASPENKFNDDSSDGQSTAPHTSAPTVYTSSDNSEVSPLSSPASSLGNPISPDASSISPKRFYTIVNEEEEQNWRDLSILPPNEDMLEGVREEEGEFVNSICSASHGEMSI